MVTRIIRHSVEDKAVYSAESHLPHGVEGMANEVWETVSTGFPLYGLPVIAVIGIVILILGAVVAWNIVGKGEGSHAGREGVRRAYRRELARQMAREDAAKIRAGEKSRKKWMQW